MKRLIPSENFWWVWDNKKIYFSPALPDKKSIPFARGSQYIPPPFTHKHHFSILLLRSARRQKVNLPNLRRSLFYWVDPSFAMILSRIDTHPTGYLPAKFHRKRRKKFEKSGVVWMDNREV